MNFLEYIQWVSFGNGGWMLENMKLGCLEYENGRKGEDHWVTFEVFEEFFLTSQSVSSEKTESKVILTLKIGDQ